MERILTKQELVQYYSNKDLQNLLWEFGRGREVVGRMIDGAYFRRPSILMYPNDVPGLVMRGAASFHSSVERWTNPLLIDERNQDELRTGFDWIIDIDSDKGVEEAKKAALIVRSILDGYGLKYIVKFSGRRGFHFCVFWENLPDAFDYKETRLRYPEIPKLLSRFLRYRSAFELTKDIIQNEANSIRSTYLEGVIHLLSPTEITQSDSKILKNLPSFITDQELERIKLCLEENRWLNYLEIDWSNRHLFRIPYSIHEKTGKASVLISPSDLEMFLPEMAEIGNFDFKDIEISGNKHGGEALISDAIFWNKKIEGAWKSEKEGLDKKPQREFVSFKDKIARENFPPCIEAILTNLKDGRKRSVFTLIAFLRSCNWTWAEVEETVLDWGKRMGMREGFVKAQLAWHKKQARNVLPPNCENGMFYKDIAICHPLPLCGKIKNPINFAIIKSGKGEKKDGQKTKRKRRVKREKTAEKPAGEQKA
ncbi:MAG: hypothetical protein JW727_00600 [Candidatus Aenigmarchaeota archaeon]|nr:hypothetical protein [Candidatus Aenigmarchaeota archaeon]